MKWIGFPLRLLMAAAAYIVLGTAMVLVNDVDDFKDMRKEMWAFVRGGVKCL